MLVDFILLIEILSKSLLSKNIALERIYSIKNLNFNKFSIEFRYGLEQDLLGNYRQWYSSYNLSSLVLGDTIF